jgi:F-type H+-transporting ATPase subunit b
VRNLVSRPRLAALLLSQLALGTAAAAEAEESVNGLQIFLGTDVGNAIFTLIVFITVIAILGKFAWKPILNGLERREQVIYDALVEAKRERQEADALLRQYKEQIEQARQEATAIVEEGKRDAETVRQRIHTEAREEADQMIDRARREIQLATDGAVKDLYDRTADLAVDVAGKIIGKELSPGDHAQLVQQSLERIRESNRAKLN